MRRTTTAAVVLAIAAGVNWSLNGGGFGHQDSPTPPHTIEPMPMPGTPQPKTKKPTEVRFGNTFEDARLLRPGKLGHATTWEDDEGRTYSFRAMGAEIRMGDSEAEPVTMDECGAWLAAGSPEDVDAFLAAHREGG